MPGLPAVWPPPNPSPTPPNELTVRANARGAGGALTAEVIPGFGVQVSGQAAVVILVHGFNVSYDAACRSYAAFLKNIGVTSGALPVYSFYWPGDEPNSLLSMLSYPIQIGHAKESAYRLYAYLASCVGAGGNPLAVNFIGHSLGCRLVMEVLRKFSQTPRC